ncbi:5'-nucleotidase C-terminal domain-containing protein [uncultured Bilophila sp.]|uniref:5'-nucleotidase C-terminal domain-containing protein n=1 Tax=uncultured Bilophila sp. TaxID=529385 RepID=UPI002621A7E4|nr:5'-nucleotidase [uncultured Bilophila sp.]
MDSYAAALEGSRSAVVGSHTLRLPDGMDACRSGDCLGGMVTADAMLEYARPYGAVMALCNGGGIRAALPAGDISRGHLLAMLPFGNTLVLRDYSGEQLRQALEHGAGQEGAKGPRLLQAAGLRYVIDGSRPAGQRIVKAEVIDAQGKAVLLDPNMRYGVILPDYMARGGDGYAMLGGGQPLPSPEPLDVDIVEAYIRNHSPLPMPITGRITRTGLH